ncbi:MAG TPA: TrkA family potassium uptake protein [Candidatus Limnocylindrales bacterium]
MRTVIVGCGRVGAMLAAMLDDGGHQVTILDTSTAAFERLPSSFRGNALRGDGTDEDTLQRAGVEDADLFLAMTEGDNRNIMAAQLAMEAFRVDQVIAKINDPLRALAYSELGIATICRTDLMANAILSHLKLPVAVVPGVRSGSGHHRHDEPDGEAGTPSLNSVAIPGIPIRMLDAAVPTAPPAADLAGQPSETEPAAARPSGSSQQEG